MRTPPRLMLIALVVLATLPLSGQDRPSVAERNGPIPGPLPLFPADNWWNLDISQAPVAPESAAFINFIGATRGIHPDFGPTDGTPTGIYGMPWVIVDSAQPKRTVFFDYDDESDGHGVPFYPIPDEAITQPYWIEGGPPGNAGVDGDRHMLIIDKDQKLLYELYALRYANGRWEAGSGALFDMKTNNRRPQGWTSADASGMAIFPGLVRRDEAFGTDPIKHAFRVTTRGVSNFVFPASHLANTCPSGATCPPLGARMRLKASKVCTGGAHIQKMCDAMKTYGLIVADTGSDMYVSGTHDPLWDNDNLNGPLGQVKAGDFEFIQLGFQSCPAGGPPGAPVNFAAVGNGVAASFSWSPATSGGTPTDYLLEAGSGPGLANLAQLALPASSTSYSVNGPPGTYYVRLRARNVCGSAVSSEQVLTLSNACTGPGVPGGPAATVAGTSVTLNWTAGAAATGYVLEAGNSPGLANLLVLPWPTTSIAATAPPATYYVRTRSTNACGTSAPSAETAVVVGGCAAPGPPSSLSFSLAGRTVTLNWGAMPGTSEYLLEAGSSAGATNILVTSLGAGTSFSAQAPPGTYFVRIRPRNPCGAGYATNDVTIAVP